MKKQIFLILFLGFSLAQVNETEKRYIRIGSLQSHFSAWGSERAWNTSYYEGLRWPADYPFQDNAVIKRSWLTCESFTDDKNQFWNAYGLYFALSYVGTGIFPMEMKQIAKFEPPAVYVDGVNLSAPYLGDIDEYDTDLPADRKIVNIVNTAMGLTMNRTIYAFSQEYHDNYFIKVFTFTNTGNTDSDDEIELTDSLRNVRIGWGTRYSGSREASWYVGGSASWGKHMWVTKRGEDYALHATDPLTEADGIVDWLRCGFSWLGQNANNSFDNIGAPKLTGKGRLTSPHHVGSVVLHVDMSPHDSTDNPDQPVFLGWHAGDTYPSVGNLQPSDEQNMQRLASMLAGNPYGGADKGGNTRMDELEGAYSTTNLVDPSTVHNDEGGTNVMITYGPFNLAHGESVTIVEAEGINGLSREMCELIGERYKIAYENSNDAGPFDLPDGTTTTDKDVYKNSWVYTGKDSLLLTFSRAKRNYDSGFATPQPPLPPPVFNVNSGGDRIFLSWLASLSETESNFAGYEVYRAVGKPDTTFDMIYSGPAGIYEFEDVTAIRGFSYYYYVCSVSDGSRNTTGIANPTGPLRSSRFYTKTNRAAFLKRQQGSGLDQIRVVPNPYHIANTARQFPGQPDKIMFYDIPGKCRIKIYTERGDLIHEINHRDGSGDQEWNSVTKYRQVITSGLYIAYFEVLEDIIDPVTDELLYRKGDSTYRKFIIIR
ncbi:MAG: fibronectin [Fidelibacterota bacterium]